MLKVSVFTGPNYLIEDEGTVSAHAFLATDGVIPEGGLVVSVDAPNLSEFDLTGVSVEGGEIVAVRDGGFDLRMTEYTTLVNVPIADDGETETGETASFSLAAGDGYEIVEDYSGGTFNLVDTRADIPRGEIDVANNTIPFATDTQISPENPSFSGSGSIYFDIGNRYLNEDGTYTYIDSSEDVDVYKVELSAGDTIAIETFEVAGNPDTFGFALDPSLAIFDAAGNEATDFGFPELYTAPDKLFGGGLDPFDENAANIYAEFTAPEDGTYYIATGGWGAVWNYPAFAESGFYDPLVPGTSGSFNYLGNYDIEIDLLTEDNPRKTGTPTPPVSNPGITEPPTLSLSAFSSTTDGEGNVTSGVVEHVDVGGISSTTFTIQADGDIPEGGIEFVLNSDANLFDYVSLLQAFFFPSTIGGQALGAFYNEDGIPTGILLRIEEPTMTVTLETANNDPFFTDAYGNWVEEFEPLETDGPEEVTFFLQSGEGYEVVPDHVTEVTYYDSVADLPSPTDGGGTGPEVGVTVSETELIETEGTETTITFTLSELPPADGVVVFLNSEQNPIVGSVLSQFDVLEAQITGGNFPVPTSNASGFFFTITEQTATITVSAFDELTVPGIEPSVVQEGILALDFALQPQPGYTIDPDASGFSVTIADNPESQTLVTLTNLDEFGEPSPPLIESEGTVGVHTFNVSSELPPEGLTVSISAPNLSDFDLAAIEVAGGTIAAVRGEGFDFTITEQTATINLPVLDDGVAEGSETATFTLEPGDNYETTPDVSEAVFVLADTLDEVSVPEEIEGNDTIAQANALGLTTDNPSISLAGQVAANAEDASEDVDLYSFNLEAGQTISLDIDSSEWNTLEFFGYPVIFPALEDVQNPDTELRLFDAQGNELAANNDGAAPGEDFSRDPYLEFTAETAGTYYVGVSALGNRNYDPNVAISGSGWTFPEVGVFYGPYELTATLKDATPPLIEPTFEPVFGSIAGDIIEVSGSNQLVFGGAQGDLIDASIGSEGGNRIYGSGGDDTLILGTGDRFLGGDGDDKFYTTYGSGNTITGGAGADQFWIATAEIPRNTTSVLEISALDGYYTFGENVSDGSDTRLLSDKATVIGFAGLETISFLQFDLSDISQYIVNEVELTLEYNSELAGNLIPATADRPVSVGAYEITAPFDNVNGNINDIDYGEEGSNAIATTIVGDDGVYSWNVTEFIQDELLNSGTGVDIALSGVFGNENIDDRNSYASFYPVGATDGLAPTLVIEGEVVNVVTDFTIGEDVIGIAGLGINFEDLSITQQGDNTLIATNGAGLAVLQGIDATSLGADNFAFA